MTKKNSKSNKYFAKKTEVDGVTFDSKKEANRFMQLHVMQRNGHIHSLARQVPFEIICSQRREDGYLERATSYVADFVYFDVFKGKIVVEDVKSPYTRKNPTYILKRKLMLKEHGIEIKEVC